jgi:hypothetical protein
VINQVIERHLLEQFENVFDLAHLFKLGKEGIQEIAQEPEDIRRQRAEITSRKLVLEHGADLCKQYMLRHGVDFVSASSWPAKASVG